MIADVPGLIEGAAQGAGLGHQFLRHLERSRVLVHLVDLSAESGTSAVADLETVEHELDAFNPELLQRTRLIVGSKLDSAVLERRDDLRRAAAERGSAFLEISAVVGDGVPELIRTLSRLLREGGETA